MPPISAEDVLYPDRSRFPCVQSHIAPNMLSAVREHFPVDLLGDMLLPALNLPAVTAANLTVLFRSRCVVGWVLPIVFCKGGFGVRYFFHFFRHCVIGGLVILY